jgi:hypothetical protein
LLIFYHYQRKIHATRLFDEFRKLLEEFQNTIPRNGVRR